MTCEPDLRLQKVSLFEATFIYKSPDNVAIDVSGQVDNADFTIYAGDDVLWTGSVLSGDITPTYSQGKFYLLIPEPDITLMDFKQARYRFRIHWVVKGWQTLATGVVIFGD